MSRPLKVFSAIALAGLLCACTEYLDHSDRMTAYSGEAIAANRVAQMVDPWPASSARRNFGTSGERMQRAMDRYKSGASSAPISATTSSSSSESGSDSGSGSGSSSGSSTTGGEQH